MKVLLLTDSDAFAGTERHMLDLAAALSPLGIEAVIGCPIQTPLSRAATESGLAHTVIPRAARPAIRALRQVLRENSFDLVHAHNGRSALFAALAGAGGKQKRCRLVSTLHFISLARESRGGFKGWASQRLHAWLASRTDRWIAISDAVLNAAQKRDPDGTSRVIKVHNGTAKKTIDVDPDAARKKLGLDSDTPLILTVARLEPEKDAPTVLAAARVLAQTYPEKWCWCIAGEGSLAGELRRKILAQWPEGDAPVRFLGRRSDISQLMQTADMLVHPAPAEPFGLVLTEAMAAGCPVVAADGGAAPEIVVDRETGSLFPPQDSIALAATVSKLLADPQKRKTYGASGRERFEAFFTAERMAQETAEAYRQAVSIRTEKQDAPLGARY